MKRLCVAAHLAALAEADAAAIDSLPRGGVWTRLVVNASDVIGNDEAPHCMRLVVERLVIDGRRLEWKLEIQTGDWPWEEYMLADGALMGEADCGADVVANYPLVGGLGDRHVARVRASRKLDVETYERHRVEGGLFRVCPRCAYESGATWAFAEEYSERSETTGMCPACGDEGHWLHLLEHWDGLPEELVARVHANVARIAATDGEGKVAA